MTENSKNFAMDGGFGRVKPLTEGYISKGGKNLSSKIIERPPAPAILNQSNGTKTQASGKSDK